MNQLKQTNKQTNKKTLKQQKKCKWPKQVLGTKNYNSFFPVLQQTQERTQDIDVIIYSTSTQSVY